ncbi:MAG: hypothetical protein PHX43_06840, partial [Alphaproteobacteria bacterium]|nr:hypothetical protein [Alphaproteobacteria bacterium]
ARLRSLCELWRGNFSNALLEPVLLRSCGASEDIRFSKFATRIRKSNGGLIAIEKNEQQAQNK